jgi:PPM family protein phosphatase
LKLRYSGSKPHFRALPWLGRSHSIPSVSISAGQTTAHRLKVASAGLTDVGRKRDHNEDSYLIDNELQLYVVADGMGGHAGGGTASRIAVETIDRELRSAKASSEDPFRAEVPLQDSPLPDAIRNAVGSACQAIFTAAQEDPRLAGMGTTVIALLVKGDQAFFAHVGDSRAYLIRGELIQQVSEDHSLVNEQIKAGMITPEEAKHSRYKNIITRSVGFEEEVQVDVMGLTLQPGDTFLLCSDGLANMVDDEELRQVIDATPLERAPEKLVEMANERGGDDNITVIVVRAMA